MANNKRENKIEKFTKEAIGKTLNQFNKEIGVADLVEINKNQDRILNGILSQVNDESTEKTEKSNIITLDNSTDGIVELKEIQGDTNVNVSKIEEEIPITHDIGDKEGNVFSLNEITQGAISIGEIQGNTMVNCNKDDKKELVLMKDLSTQGDNNIDITEGVDGGLVDIALEGNTMVNVCDQKDPVAITKSYTVETGNHVALQGEYDGKCRPVVNGNTLVNLFNETNFKKPSYNNLVYWDGNIIKTSSQAIDSESGNFVLLRYVGSILKQDTVYTFVIRTKGTFKGYIFGNDFETQINNEGDGIHKIVFTYNGSTNETYRMWVGTSTPTNLEVEFLLLLEGDYTNKPIPEYFSGLQSSFEDNLVTQEMVDNGEELAENLGKYKVDYVVTGKNKVNDIGYIPSKWSGDHINHKVCDVNLIQGKTYTFSCSSSISDYRVNIRGLKDGVDTWGYQIVSTSRASFTLNNECDYFYISAYKFTDEDGVINIQIEEGTEATPYERYKEHKKTFYLNSPLLEGDTIEQQGDNVVHVHRYGKVVLDGSEAIALYSLSEDYPDVIGFYIQFDDIKGDKFFIDKYSNTKNILPGRLDINYEAISITRNFIKMTILKSKLNTVDLNGIKSYLQNNPITIVYDLQTPQYEVISPNDTILCDSYVNGHLDIDSVVPIKGVNFMPTQLSPLKYVYEKTKYTLQFESDNVGKIDYLMIGQETKVNIDVIKGINKINITTFSTSPYIDFRGIGFNVSNIVVTPAIDQDFGYFEGMKSVGECEELEIRSSKGYLKKPRLIDGFVNGKTGILSQPTGEDGQKCYVYECSPNTTYNVTGWITGVSKTIACFDEFGYGKVATNKLYVENRTLSNITFTTTENSKYLILMVMTSTLDCRPTLKVQVDKLNKQQLTHEPLRAVGDAKDRYVLIDGKWYIERNCWEYIIPQDTVWTKTNMVSNNGKYTRYYFIMDNMITDQLNASNYVNFAISDLLPFGYSNSWGSCNRNEIQIINNSTEFYVQLDKTTIEEVASLMNGSKIIYRLKTPVYEEIDYNPFEVYSDTTHITTNSTIPTNIIVKNHGFNCLLKPSTTYTVSSNLGLNTVTTGADIGDSCLRFYDTDTSTVTKMKDVMVLEGDWTTGKPLPSHFSGIESAFEQEYDEAVGKYKVKIKVVGKNLFGINNLTNGLSNGNFIAKEFNINGDSVTLTGGMAVLKFESNKNTDYHLSFTFKSNQNNDTPRVYIYDKYLNQIYFMNGSNVKFNSKNNDTLYIGLYIAMLNGYRGSYSNIQLEQGTNATPYESYKESIIEFYIDEPLRGIGDVKDKVYVKNDKVVVKRNCGSVTFDGSDDENLNFNRTLDNSIRFDVPYPNISTSRDYTIICNRFKYATDNSMDSILNHTSLSLFTFYIAKSKLQSQDTAGFKQWLQHNPTTVVYKLASPTYEEVEYSESRLFLDTYNNSTLFYESNIPVSNTSFKPLWEELVYLKNSTKYYIQFNSTASGTVVFNLGGTEVTKDIVEGYNNIAIDTPAETTNLLTIDGHGIKISEVVVSESVCGGHYLGLQSCFEEHMENGKYVCTIRGIALDGSKVSGIKLYLDEPLRGIENVKDRLCIKDGKLMVERKCGSTTFDGSNDEDIDEYRFENINSQTNTTAFLISEPKAKTAYNLNNFYCDKFKFLSNIWNEDQDYEGINENNFNKFIIRINRIKLQTQDIAGFRQYLQQNSTTVVYELIEPTYEEATNEYGLPIVFEGYENGIVYVDSAVTPTTHIKYTSNNVLATTLSEAEEQNIATQEDINMNVITYMMDIDMMLTDMEMNNDISVMAVRRDSSNENMLDRMSEEDKKVYRDNTVVMLEKMITAQALEKEDIERRVNMYYNKNRISKEQYNYLKSLL